jgi:hypothetical protein
MTPTPFCAIGFLDINALWGEESVIKQLNGSYEINVFVYVNVGEISIDPENTWNWYPAVDHAAVVATITVSYSPEPYSLPSFSYHINT